MASGLCLGGNFCFCRLPTELRAKGKSRGSRVPAGRAFCLGTWNLGVAFPGHPSPHQNTSAPAERPSPTAAREFCPKSPAQRQTAPLRAARLTFAQLARRGAPLRPPPRTLRVSRSWRAGLPPSAAALPGLGALPRAPAPCRGPCSGPWLFPALER